LTKADYLILFIATMHYVPYSFWSPSKFQVTTFKTEKQQYMIAWVLYLYILSTIEAINLTCYENFRCAFVNAFSILHACAFAAMPTPTHLLLTNITHLAWSVKHLQCNNKLLTHQVIVLW